MKEAVKYMIETKPALEPLFIVFDSNSRQVTAEEVQRIKYEWLIIIRILCNLIVINSAVGGTSFTSAMTEITNLLNSKKVSEDLDLAVVFMTDGNN